MTIITKPLSEKKGDKLITPLENDEFDQYASAPFDDMESQTNILILPSRAHRVSTMTTLCLLLTALFVVGIGIIGGTYLYDQYLRVQTVQRNLPGKFEGWAQIPYYSSETENSLEQFDAGDQMISDEDLNNFKKTMQSFNEQFEIDNDENYEKINVPDFKDDRNGRFIHDFNTNITCIIDTSANRCFIMPLDRENILPPKSLFDLIHKMWDGYYKIDTKVVRETMKVVTPPVSDLSNIGHYISRECEGRPVYQLEKYVGGVVKRSADLHQEAKFAQFAGKGILEFDIINMEEVAEYERMSKNL